MDELPSIEVKPTLEFRNSLRSLSKKYRKIRTDIEPVIEQIQMGCFLGNPIPGSPYCVYKVRILNSDVKKGKRAGYRLVYWVQTLETTTSIILVTIYSKSDQETVRIHEIKEIIERFSLVPNS